MSFQEWLQEIQPWLNVTGGRMTSSQQAAALQQGLRGIAREYALGIPPVVITQGVLINGVMSDPVTYLLYLLSIRFEALEDERSTRDGNALLDFNSRPGERIDSILTRFDLTRHRARTVGADLGNYHQLATLLIRAIRATPAQMYKYCNHWQD